MGRGTRESKSAEEKRAAGQETGRRRTPLPLVAVSVGETEARPNNRPAFLASRRPLVAPALPPLAPTSLCLSDRQGGSPSPSPRHGEVSRQQLLLRQGRHLQVRCFHDPRFLLPRSILNFLALGQRTWNPSLFLTLTRIHNYFSLWLRCNPFSSLPFGFAVQFSTEELY